MIVLGLVVAALAAATMVGCSEDDERPRCSMKEENPCGESSYCEAKRSGDEGRCQVYPESSAIKFDLPFPKGARMYCAQGNLNKDMAASHAVRSNNRTCQFAFDFASPANRPPVHILAGAGGVIYAYGGCATENILGQEYDDCNNGFGNMMKIDHGNGYYTLYAHLSAIAVRSGTYVHTGDIIGLEGNTGMAGGKHIHWSLHKGDASRKRMGASSPFSVIYARDVTNGESVASEMSWKEFMCGSRVFEGAHVYESRIQGNDNIESVYGLDLK